MSKPTAHISSHTYRPDIDGLRALAIIFVVLYHAFPSMVTGGFIGVDIFFVISGFLISTIIYTQLDSGVFSFTKFYIRRVKRIFPALFLVLTFCFIFSWFNLLADEFKQLGLHIFGGASFISNLILWNESGYFDNASETKPLLHLWSLGIEEQFYFIWPIFLWVASNRKIRFIWIGFAVGIVSFGANIYEVYYGQNFSSAFYLPINRFWELMIGAILAYLKVNQGKFPPFPIGISDTVNKYINRDSVKNGISILGALLLVVGVLLIGKNSLFPGFWALLPVLGAVFVIGAGQHAWINRQILSRRPLVWIGLISFPLYLWHWPLLSFAHLLQGSMPSVEIRGLTVTISILLSAATYYLVEKPIRSNHLDKTKALALTFLLILVGYIGLNTYQRDGLTFRLNQIQFRLPPILQSLSIKDPTSSGLDLPAPKLDCSNEGGPKDNSPKTCLTIAELKKPAVFIWGDSYGAHLTTGYEERFGKDFQIIRKFYNGCPPIMDLELPNHQNCSIKNRQIFEQVLKERPAKLIIAANWTDYDWDKIDGTINKLHQAGYQSIDLVGPAPVWSDGLYKQLYLKFLADKDPNIPYRMKFGLDARKDFLIIDLGMRAMAKRMGVRYISISNILCNEDGCITRFGDTSDTLESFDAGHFTKKASQYVVSKFPEM